MGIKVQRSVTYTTSDGHSFATKEEAELHERSGWTKPLLGLTAEDIQDILTGGNRPLCNAIEKAGQIVRTARLKAGELRRPARKKKAEAPAPEAPAEAA